MPASTKVRKLLALILVGVSGISVLTALLTDGEAALPGEGRYAEITPIEQDNLGVAPTGSSDDPGAMFDAPVTGITIPSIGVQARVVALGVTQGGYMDLPYSPHEVAWYEFTGKPGSGGNAVFSAHLDYIGYGPAVFWNLRKVSVGEPVWISLADGTTLEYKVNEAYITPLAALDMSALLAPTDTESITLITCAGEFVNGDYTERVIVRATRTSILHRRP